jgi:sulfur carrier protein
MTLTVNGQTRAFEATTTIADLLDTLGLTGKPVVVEHNQIALLPKEIHTTPVAEGDIIEIVQITAGG